MQKTRERTALHHCYIDAVATRRNAVRPIQRDVGIDWSKNIRHDFGRSYRRRCCENVKFFRNDIPRSHLTCTPTCLSYVGTAGDAHIQWCRAVLLCCNRYAEPPVGRDALLRSYSTNILRESLPEPIHGAIMRYTRIRCCERSSTARERIHITSSQERFLSSA